MEPTRDIADSLFRERVLRARRTPIEQKILSGAELFDYATRIALAGIRNQHPDADENTVQAIYQRRMEIARKLEGR